MNWLPGFRRIKWGAKVINYTRSYRLKTYYSKTIHWTQPNLSCICPGSLESAGLSPKPQNLRGVIIATSHFPVFAQGRHYL
eukprot:14277067-Heterocapsa_arctica.AAC.1